jgi:hypothetical protein
MNSNSRPIDDASSKNPAELALEIYNLLYPHPSEMRLRAIQSAMTSLGENVAPPKLGAAKGSGAAQLAGDFEDLTLGPRATKWAQKHSISRAMLEEVFHFLDDGRIEISASSIPGASRREMTVNCYLLSGLRGLLKDDVPSFEDGDAIAECKRTAAYDKNNHTSNRQSVGNKMTGTRPNFTLTGPGEIAAAELVRQMVPSEIV